ncbi:uncharacterized protein [Antedon mediterranea]|uniref:uncharacterized protein isoform X2 n=1 Tax=Antedon mediterranea TaxID=105859 RepID=UPI003AF98DAD
MENIHVVLFLAVLFVTFIDTTGLKSGDDNAQCNDYCKAKAECVIACLKSGDVRAQCNDVCTEKATCMLSCLEDGYDRDKCTKEFRLAVKSEESSADKPETKSTSGGGGGGGGGPDTNLCEHYPCYNSGKCILENGGTDRRCLCRAGFFGTNCERVNNCDNCRREDMCAYACSSG